ncbi:TetR/AcrR family transcriptional regulator [Streptomyces sp. WMMB303]|uniref:TetR/AcrR family transcriptional regulator n=1 Tax=Streptomyces sp. WMMB303 TaxID=3034154 RepID=UPI0023EC6B92|nr:TetR/AcrR family transcriptional regulator [Streptomyces sp. WMMB303]MDF4252187.1 TetR/AcrR family transcriptional regulator [Streptomyces sp. WMMB303]
MTAQHSAAPRSRRERPAKPALSREGIVATAVALMRAEGLQRVTMRRLARELDTGPASLYVYVRNTAALHAAVLDGLLGEVDLDPAVPGGDWQESAVAVLDSYTRVLLAHPQLARAALAVQPSGPHYLALLETLLRLLHEGGVPDDRAAWGVDVLLQTATATAAEHATGDEAGRAGAATRSQAGTALADTPAATHPRLAAVGADLFTGTPEERLGWAFRVLLNGIRHTPRA